MKISMRYYVAIESSEIIRWQHKFNNRNRKPLLNNIQKFSGLIFTNVEYVDNDTCLWVQIIIRDTSLDTIFFINFAISTSVCSNEIEDVFLHRINNGDWILILAMDDAYLHCAQLSGINHFVDLNKYFRDDVIKIHPSFLSTVVKMECFNSDTQFNVKVEEGVFV